MGSRRDALLALKDLLGSTHAAKELTRRSRFPKGELEEDSSFYNRLKGIKIQEQEFCIAVDDYDFEEIIENFEGVETVGFYIDGEMVAQAIKEEGKDPYYLVNPIHESWASAWKKEKTHSFLEFDESQHGDAITVHKTESLINPEIIFETTEWEDGTMSCTCPGFSYPKDGQLTCKHIVRYGGKSYGEKTLIKEEITAVTLTEKHIGILKRVAAGRRVRICNEYIELVKEGMLTFTKADGYYLMPKGHQFLENAGVVQEDKLEEVKLAEEFVKQFQEGKLGEDIESALDAFIKNMGIDLKSKDPKVQERIVDLKAKFREFFGKVKTIKKDADKEKAEEKEESLEEPYRKIKEDSSYFFPSQERAINFKRGILSAGIDLEYAEIMSVPEGFRVVVKPKTQFSDMHLQELKNISDLTGGIYLKSAPIRESVSEEKSVEDFEFRFRDTGQAVNFKRNVLSMGFPSIKMVEVNGEQVIVRSDRELNDEELKTLKERSYLVGGEFYRQVGRKVVDQRINEKQVDKKAKGKKSEERKMLTETPDMSGILKKMNKTFSKQEKDQRIVWSAAGNGLKAKAAVLGMEENVLGVRVFNPFPATWETNGFEKGLNAIVLRPSWCAYQPETLVFEDENDIYYVLESLIDFMEKAPSIEEVMTSYFNEWEITHKKKVKKEARKAILEHLNRVATRRIFSIESQLKEERFDIKTGQRLSDLRTSERESMGFTEEGVAETSIVFPATEGLDAWRRAFEVESNMRLSVRDKHAILAFTRKSKANGNHIATDGSVLSFNIFPSKKEVAIWEKNQIKIITNRKSKGMDRIIAFLRNEGRKSMMEDG